MDANQRWDVGEAISWVTSLAPFRPLWIEEPTSPDDILGHATISKVRGHIYSLTLCVCVSVCVCVVATRPQERLYHSGITIRQGPFKAQ